MKKQPNRIPITAAKNIASKYNQDQVILLTWNKTDGLTHVVTYGKSLTDCDQAAQGGNNIRRFLGWPEDLCNMVPSRMKKKNV